MEGSLLAGVGACSSRLLPGAVRQGTSGCSARAPVASVAKRPRQLFINKHFTQINSKNQD